MADNIELEGYKVALPDWVNFIAKDPEGDYMGYEFRPLLKRPWAFWKCQRGQEIDLCEGLPYQDGTGGDIAENYLWKVERSPNGTPKVLVLPN